jgi:hypothetical protein
MRGYRSLQLHDLLLREAGNLVKRLEAIMNEGTLGDPRYPSKGERVERFGFTIPAGAGHCDRVAVHPENSGLEQVHGGAPPKDPDKVGNSMSLVDSRMYVSKRSNRRSRAPTSRSTSSKAPSALSITVTLGPKSRLRMSMRQSLLVALADKPNPVKKQLGSR